MKSTFLILLTLFSLQVFSQDQPKQDKKNSNCMKFSSFSIGIQNMLSSNNSTGFADMQRLIPKNDPLFNPSLTKYDHNNQNSGLLNLNIKLGLSSKPNRELLIGISYITGIRRGDYFNKSTKKHIDTLTVENYTFYVDSSYYSNYSFTDYAEELGLDVSYIFRSNQSKKISVFTGIGLYAGYSIYSDITVSYSHDSSRNIYTKPNNDDFYQNINPYYGNFDYNPEEKSVKTDPSLFFRGYIPVGLNWNLSKKNEFWKHMNFVYQGAFGLEYRYITNDKGYLKPYFGMSMFGLKYTF